MIKRVAETNILPIFTMLLYITVATYGAFTGGIWAVIGIGGAIVLFLTVAAIERKMLWPQRSFILLVSICLLNIALLNLQSSQPALSWREWLKLASIFLPLILLTNTVVQARLYHRNFFAVLSVAVGIGAVALGMELDSDGFLLKARKGPDASLTEYNRGLSYLLLLALPCLASIWYSKHRWRLAPFGAALLIPCLLTESRATQLALMAALFVIVTAHYWPIATRRGLLVLLALTVAWPFAVQNYVSDHAEALRDFPDSWHARMEIWDYLSYRIQERPWLGWGLGSTHTLPMVPHEVSYTLIRIPAAHPHNMMTQLWVELGIPGLILGLSFGMLMLDRASKFNARIAPFAMGAWAAAFVLLLVAYNLWTDSLFAAFALVALAFVMLEKDQKV